jgi:imidazolonepropionase-like amidohydrolase
MSSNYIFNLLSLSLICGASLCANADETLIKNGTVLTVTKGTIKNGDVLVRDGKIVAVGKGLKAATGAKIIDATGKFVMPGILDAHSHMAIEGGINEGTETVAAECDIEDVINEKDNGIKWALAGGVTTINTMHGSANPIGAKVSTLKLRWGKSAEELLFKGARKHIKFALGENPKRVHAERGITTRLGVAETLRETFTKARDYQRDWDDYRRATAAGEKATPPRKDLKMETMAAVLRGEIWVQCHCYRADEIEMILHLSDEFGFKIGALQHVLEGYKVAAEMAKRNVGGSTFADFWGYKLEAYDGIDHNAAIMNQYGVRASLNSDSGERIRRLNTDAARLARYGGMNDDQCLALITINAAWQLGVDSKVGSLEAGKDADISIWDAHPLSVYAKCTTTLVDGQVYFERKPDGKAAYGIQTPETVSAAATVATAETKPVTQSKFVPLDVPSQLPMGGSFALTGANIYTVSGPVIEHGTIVVKDGRIEAVGKDVSIPRGVKVVDARGLNVYPGFINASTNLGLSEIESIDMSRDLGENGNLKAHLFAADAYNLHSAWVGVALCAGVTTALVSPQGSGWMGQSALLHTSGKTVEEVSVAKDLFQSLRIGGGGFGGGFGGGADDSAVSGQITKALADARDYGTKLDAYKRSADSSVRPPRGDLTSASLVAVTKGTRGVLIPASGQTSIESAVKFGIDNQVRVLVSGGSGGLEAAETLNKAGVPFIYTGVLNMPGGTEYDASYTMPLKLYKAGVKFCLATNESTNLALFAGIAAAFGLPKDEALKAVTLYPAEILGFGKDLGSIEVGKIADLLVTDGDPLEYKTNIKRAFINGNEVVLTSRHQQFYEQFRKK